METSFLRQSVLGPQNTLGLGVVALNVKVGLETLGTNLFRIN